MAAELPRPGVEVIQEFAAASPTILQPTLVPFVCGPAKEVIEVTDADGLVNEDALQGNYDQLPQVIAQNAFPSPRGNIQEVNVEEGTIETHLLFGGVLNQLDRDPGSAFLTAHNEARRAVIESVEITGAGLAIQDLTIVLAIDVRSRLNTTEDVTVTFASVGGGNLTAQQIADQINAAVGDEVAEVVEYGANNRVRIASTIYGAASSVTLRAGGSGNTLFGAVSDAVEYRVEGAGFHAQDQANNTVLSPYVVWSQGRYLEDGVSASFPAENAAELYFGQIKKNLDGTETFSAAVAPSITFTGPGSIDLKVGDYFYADGVRPNTSAEVSRVEENRFKLGVVNATLSTFDEDGNVLTAVYDNSNLTILFGSAPFAPQWAWFKARNISADNPAALAAELLGAIQGNPAEVGSITSSGATGPFALAGLTLITKVTLDGVEQAENTFTFTGGPFATMADVVLAIGTNIPNVVASDDAGELVLSTTKTGDNQSVQLLATSTALTALSLTAGTGTGKDVEFVDVAAVLVGATESFPFNETTGETLVIEGSSDGGDTWTAFTRTFTSPSTGSAFGDIASLLAFLNTGTSWDGGTLPTEFVITNSGNQLVITSAATGSNAAIRIGSASTMTIGVAASSALQFTNGDMDVGEENLAGQIFKLRLNDRPQIYTVVFTSDSLNDAVDEINNVVGWPVASIGGGLEDQLLLTSTLEGAASKVEVIDDGVNNLAMSAFGFTTGNVEATGSGRPNADFFLDAFGQVNLGAEILRNAVTGQPYGPGSADIYVQYIALRLDVSPQASDPAVISLSDVTTLQTVLNPVTSQNPLGLAMFFQLINAPGIVSKGMGISATSAAAPEGTAIAYTEVTNFLESEEVYAVAPLTQDKTVFDIFRTHIDFMSGAEQKGERILIMSPPVPTRAVDDVMASGLSANTTATQNELILDVNPTSALVAAGINPSGTIPADDDLFVQLTVATGSGQEVRYYNVQTVNGTLVVFRTTFASGENADAFYSTTPLTETLVNADWSMKVRGAPLLIPGSTLPDKNKIAETVAALNSGIKNRRVFSLFPDTIKASLSGTEELLPSYYAAAAITGMIASQPPQQGFTNLPMTGFTGVQGSSDTFSTRQLNVMAAGGTYILVQDADGAPVICRHQLSTDLASIETRELSITKVVDYVAKFMRVGLRNFIGTFNITQPFLDTLSTVIQGMLSFLTESGTILGGDLNNLIQDTTQPDTVLVDVTLDVPFPCNYIRLTLVI